MNNKFAFISGNFKKQCCTSFLASTTCSIFTSDIIGHIVSDEYSDTIGHIVSDEYILYPDIDPDPKEGRIFPNATNEQWKKEYKKQNKYLFKKRK
jgi:hypothetical protein